MASVWPLNFAEGRLPMRLGFVRRQLLPWTLSIERRLSITLQTGGIWMILLLTLWRRRDARICSKPMRESGFLPQTLTVVVRTSSVGCGLAVLLRARDNVRRKAASFKRGLWEVKEEICERMGGGLEVMAEPSF